MSTNETEQNLRQVFKKFNPLMVWFWRIGLGRWINAWPPVFGRIMVINHIGRKSGLTRRTPVNYAVVKNEIYCTAGFGEGSDWYKNIKVNPRVEIWLPDGWWAGSAEDVGGLTDRLSLLRQVIIASGIVAPLMGINPQRMSDQEFEQITQEYRLLRINRTARLYGSGGPGDLVWIWGPVLIAAGFVFWLRRAKR